MRVTLSKSTGNIYNSDNEGSVAEWSKALVLGTSPKGRGFESHRCQHSFANPGLVLHMQKKAVETPGIEPGASRMRSERSTTELHPLPCRQIWTHFL
jgi:hypothetical protein